MRTSRDTIPAGHPSPVLPIGRLLRLPGLFALAIALLSGCGGDTIDDLYGEWRTSGGTTVTLGADGTWGAQHSLYGPEPFDWGTFTFDGETLTFFTAAGGLSCQEGQTGIYEATISGDSLDMKQIEEPCPGRSDDFRYGMVRKAS
jgi:hypothetical protein